MSKPKSAPVKSLRLNKETLKTLTTRTDIRTGFFFFPTGACATGPNCLVLSGGFDCAGASAGISGIKRQ